MRPKKEEKNDYKNITEVIFGIAHEIRNPLNAIELLASLQYEELLGKNQDVSLITDILSGAKKINNVITNLLYFACLPNPRFEKIKLQEIFEEILMFSCFSLKLNNIKLTTVLDDEHVELFADREQIKQCFINLILNSLQNLPEGGRINIHSRLIKRGSNPWVCIEFIDTRKIIDTYNTPKFSEKFDLQNTNIELPITKKIISQHRGKIQVSLKGKFKITIFLPLHQKKCAQHNASLQLQSKPQKRSTQKEIYKVYNFVNSVKTYQ